MAFHEIRFPAGISLGASGGPERRTEIVVVGSGAEERNSRWADSKRSYNAGYGVKHADDLHAIIGFFEERRGRLHGFRWKDWSDYKSCPPQQSISAADQTIGTGDGITAAFQLIKVYGSSFAPWSREIVKPVAETVLIAVNGVDQASNFAVASTTGVVTFTEAAIPAIGAAITAGFEFDVPVRFDTDQLSINLSLIEAGSIPNIPIVEISAVRSLPSELQSHLDNGATTLCWCWRLTRDDGTGFGFTDHDRDLSFDDTLFEAATGFTGTEISGAVGLNVDTLDVESAIRSDRLSEDDLRAGLFDNALIEIYRVNWQDPAQRVLMRYGNLGEVSRSRHYFKAEVRGLAHELQQPQGRIIQYACDADLGDSRCGIDLNAPAYKGTGAVSAIRAPRIFAASGLDGFANDFFSRGLLSFTSGANLGLSAEAKVHANVAGAVSFELWQEMPNAVAAGDGFSVTAGCDKAHTTCLTKFANFANYRGFPHVPGTDFALTYVSSSDNNDGGQPDVTREEIAAAAQGWLGTPYHHQASLAGIGCDCLGLVRGVWRELCGAEPERLPAYSRDWGDATDSEGLLGAAGRNLVPIEKPMAGMGDVLVFRMRAGGAAKHAGILVTPGRFIHAQEGLGVIEADYIGWWQRRTVAAYRFPGAL